MNNNQLSLTTTSQTLHSNENFLNEESVLSNYSSPQLVVRVQKLLLSFKPENDERIQATLKILYNRLNQVKDLSLKYPAHIRTQELLQYLNQNATKNREYILSDMERMQIKLTNLELEMQSLKASNENYEENLKLLQREFAALNQELQYNARRISNELIIIESTQQENSNFNEQQFRLKIDNLTANYKNTKAIYQKETDDNDMMNQIIQDNQSAITQPNTSQFFQGIYQNRPSQGALINQTPQNESTTNVLFEAMDSSRSSSDENDEGTPAVTNRPINSPAHSSITLEQIIQEKSDAMHRSAIQQRLVRNRDEINQSVNNDYKKLSSSPSFLTLLNNAEMAAHESATGQDIIKVVNKLQQLADIYNLMKNIAKNDPDLQKSPVEIQRIQNALQERHSELTTVLRLKLNNQPEDIIEIENLKKEISLLSYKLYIVRMITEGEIDFLLERINLIYDLIASKVYNNKAEITESLMIEPQNNSAAESENNVDGAFVEDLEAFFSDLTENGNNIANILIGMQEFDEMERATIKNQEYLDNLSNDIETLEEQLQKLISQQEIGDNNSQPVNNTEKIEEITASLTNLNIKMQKEIEEFSDSIIEKIKKIDIDDQSAYEELFLCANKKAYTLEDLELQINHYRRYCKTSVREFYTNYLECEEDIKILNNDLHNEKNPYKQFDKLIRTIHAIGLQNKENILEVLIFYILHTSITENYTLAKLFADLDKPLKYSNPRTQLFLKKLKFLINKYNELNEGKVEAQMKFNLDYFENNPGFAKYLTSHLIETFSRHNNPSNKYPNDPNTEIHFKGMHDGIELLIAIEYSKAALNRDYNDLKQLSEHRGHNEQFSAKSSDDTLPLYELIQYPNRTKTIDHSSQNRLSAIQDSSNYNSQSSFNNKRKFDNDAISSNNENSDSAIPKPIKRKFEDDMIKDINSSDEIKECYKNFEENFGIENYAVFMMHQGSKIDYVTLHTLFEALILPNIEKSINSSLLITQENIKALIAETFGENNTPVFRKESPLVLGIATQLLNKYIEQAPVKPIFSQQRDNEVRELLRINYAANHASMNIDHTISMPSSTVNKTNVVDDLSEDDDFERALQLSMQTHSEEEIKRQNNQNSQTHKLN